jgi:hypothetical protein
VIHVVVAKTMVKNANKTFIQNQDALVRCKNCLPHLFEGLALGTSYENGQLYDQVRTGRVAKVYCGY